MLSDFQYHAKFYDEAVTTCKKTDGMDQDHVVFVFGSYQTSDSDSGCLKYRDCINIVSECVSLATEY